MKFVTCAVDRIQMMQLLMALSRSRARSVAMCRYVWTVFTVDAPYVTRQMWVRNVQSVAGATDFELTLSSHLSLTGRISVNILPPPPPPDCKRQPIRLRNGVTVLPHHWYVIATRMTVLRSGVTVVPLIYVKKSCWKAIRTSCACQLLQPSGHLFVLLA